MSSRILKKIIVLILACTFIGLLWLTFKPYDYVVSFKTKAVSGTINQTVKLWTKTLDNAKIIEQNRLNKIKQRITFQDSTYSYHWQFFPINDSLTQVKIGINNAKSSFKNRMNNLFRHTDFEKRIKITVTHFVNILNEHLKKFNVTIEGETKTPKVYCAYVSVKTKQFQKAKGMMQNYGLLNTVLHENNVVLNGKPLVEITYWDTKTDSIHYNFCYPIIKHDTLPQHKSIKYKELKSIKAIKAIYNGNYITSDRSWYALLKHAEKNNIKVEHTPIEIFHNNPNIGGNELEWKAEIYMPLKE